MKKPKPKFIPHKEAWNLEIGGTGLDLKQFKKWLKKNIGAQCHDECWDCIVCRSWRLYDEIEMYQRFIKILDKFGALPPPESDH